ncbi:MAG: DUF1501 domain-containing protein, partial [Planctomycetota bacterium]
MSHFKQPQFPCNLTRRELVWQMGGGVAGLALMDLLGRDGFPSAVRADETTTKRTKNPAVATATGSKPARGGNPLEPKQPHQAGRAKNVIFLTMNGGPSQVDTFDYQPELQKYAGQPLPRGKEFINSGGRKFGFLTTRFRTFRPGG